MEITIRRAVDHPGFADFAQSYRAMRWTVAATATGVSLVTGPAVCGVEMNGEPVADLLRLMHRRALLWPTLDIPGNRRLIVLAAGPANDDEVRAVRAAHATLRRGGARIPLPPTMLVGGPVRWVIPPKPAAELPSLEALTAVIRVATDWRYVEQRWAAS